MVQPFTVDPEWATTFDELIYETIGKYANGADAAAQWLADTDPANAMMVAHAIEHTTTEWGDGPNFPVVSFEIIQHLTPMLGIRVLDHGIEQPFTPPETDGEGDPSVAMLNCVLALGVLKSRFTWLTFMHAYLSTGISWDEAEAKVRERNAETDRAPHPDEEPDWRVIQPGYWEL